MGLHTLGQREAGFQGVVNQQLVKEADVKENMWYWCLMR